MPLPLTPRSLKRKLQQTLTAEEQNDLNREILINFSDTNSDTSSVSSQRSPPTELFLSTDHSHYQMRSSPIRLHSSPNRSTKSATSNSPKVATGSSLTQFQLDRLQNLFKSRPTPFPLELLKPNILTEFFLKGRALERYFQHRHEGIQQSQKSNDTDLGLRPLQRPFVRSSPPSVPFSVYLERLFRYCHPEPLHLISIVAYSERLIKKHQMFVPLSGLHRFVVAAWIVAGKALLGDQYWTNPYWARVAGISIPEICSLEKDLILLLKWHLQIPIEELTAAWYLLQL